MSRGLFRRLTNFCCESTARTGYFLNYHVVFGSDINATDNAMAHNATIRTMRRGFARVMDQKTIIDLLPQRGLHVQGGTGAAGAITLCPAS